MKIFSICFYGVVTLLIFACGAKDKEKSYQIQVWQTDSYGLESTKLFDESGKDSEKKAKELCETYTSCSSVCSKLQIAKQEIAYKYECKWNNDMLKSSQTRCVCP